MALARLRGKDNSDQNLLIVELPSLLKQPPRRGGQFVSKATDPGQISMTCENMLAIANHWTRVLHPENLAKLIKIKRRQKTIFILDKEQNGY
jgi:hypothetical protein